MVQLLRAWFWAVRPFTLPASVVPVLVGTALAFHDGRFEIWRFVLTLVGSMLVQIGTNLVDEYTDHVRGGSQRKLLAPYKVIALGLLSPQAVRAGAILSFGVATGIGLSLVVVTSWSLLLFCAASLIVAYGYSAGPMPLGNVGLGQPLVFVFMGLLMVMATYYVQTATLTSQAWLAGLPVACLVTAILVVNDLRDIDEDRQTGKITPVSHFGRGFGLGTFLLLVSGAYVSVLLWVVMKPALFPLLLVLLALPKAVVTTRLIKSGATRATLNQALRSAAQLHLQFGGLMALGLVISRLLSPG
ncbi:MAG TPA: 1,4-dihydroxy-2-naphthoate octaprenyltransferase [Candidatus Tectomicrobia bacterium]|nr:1,4-dihydroxy-2-naphthoate octaprenyltransferase [Candidatus Tectomicrobia bacterium]